MPSIIDPETMNVDELPGIWSPVQWELTEEERIQELEAQAQASLLNTVDAPEAILRLVLVETDIQRAFDPPTNYDPERQGEWNSELVTFQFKRPIRLLKVEREREMLYVEYYLEGGGYWAVEIMPDSAVIRRI